MKVAAFAAFLRVFVSLGYGKNLVAPIQNNLHDILWVIAAATMILGNIVALTQTNIKRMLAYSSISHTGYLLVGMIAASRSEMGYAPIAMYLASYSVMNLGAFTILSMVGSKFDRHLSLNDFSGLAKRSPWLAFALSVFMFSMAGIPPTAGFSAKYFLLYSAVQAGEVPLVIVSVICSAISVYYYLRVMVYMYMKDPIETESRSGLTFYAAFVVLVMVLLTLQVGVMPSALIEVTKSALAHF